jgi:riboflavin synthase
MFTGIIQDTGHVSVIDRHGDWVITISAPKLISDLSIGASVACSGVCLTVVNIFDSTFVVQASQETLSKTTLGGWQIGTKVNLERALKLGDEFGGHIVSGHIDGVAMVVSREEVGDSMKLVIEVPQPFACYLASKGSVALDGISLTVNEVRDAQFSVNIIPHTRYVTTIGACDAGDHLNFEADLIARYVERMLTVRETS